MADKICLPLTTPLLLHKARCGASSRWKHLPLSRNWWKMHSLHNCLSINIASHHLCLALNLSRSNTVQYHMNQYETAAVQFLSASYLEASVPFCQNSCILQDKISMLSASESFWIFIQNLLKACTQRHIWHEPCALYDQANSGTCHDA